MNGDKGRSWKMQRSQSWVDFKGILWSLVYWFTIPMVYCKGLPSPWYREDRLKSSQDGHHRHFPRLVDPGQATSRDRSARDKPTLTDNNGGQNDLFSHNLGYFIGCNHLLMGPVRCRLILDAIRSLRFIEIGTGWWVYLCVYLCSSSSAKILSLSSRSADFSDLQQAKRKNF